MNNNYEKVRSSRNELEAILRIRGISKQKFGRILNIKGSTIEKYVENPYYMRYYQMQRFANFLNIDVKDIIDIIEVDLETNSITVEGEENFTGIESLVTHNEQQLMTEEARNAVNCFTELIEEKKNIKKNIIEMNNYFAYSGKQELNDMLVSLMPSYRNTKDVSINNDMTKYILKDYRKLN